MSSFKIRPDGLFDPEGKYPNPLTNQPYSKIYSKFAFNKDPKGWSLFTAYTDRIKILKKIHNNKILILSLPTGVGKTVIIPKLLLHYFGYEKKIIVTTPRQETTASAGVWASTLLDVPLFHLDDKGDTIIDKKNETNEYGGKFPTGYKIVGYKHGDEKKYFDKTTKLLFTTDGSVKGMITGADPYLEDYGGIIIDEVHERSLDIDTVISLVMNILKKRPNFKIIFMSATMDTSIFEDYFKRIGHGYDYSIYSLPDAGTTYPVVNKLQTKKGPSNASGLSNLAYDKVLEIMKTIEASKDADDKIGNILIFLASESDIKTLIKKINNNINIFHADNKPMVYKLTSKNTKSEIDNATGGTETIPKGYARKIIIATPMAESSITFKGKLKYIIDSGIAYTKSFDAKRYCFVNGKNYTTRANIGQRCGRTGRTCAGECIQLYTKDQLNNFNEFTQPKILEEDFTKNLLNLLKLTENENNIQKTLNFVKNMIEPFGRFKDYVKVAYTNLKEMDFIDPNGDLSSLGLICSDGFDKFDVKIAKMIICGHFFNCIEYTIILGAILHHVSNLSDIIIELSDEDKKNKLKLEHYNKTINNLIYSESDHITLLIIVNNYLNSTDPFAFTKNNYLNNKVLLEIKNTHIKLRELITKQDSKTKKYKLEEFSKLQQFKNIGKFTMNGGFKLNNKNLLYNKNETRTNNKTTFYNSKTKRHLFTKTNNYVGGVYSKSTNSRNAFRKKSTRHFFKRQINTKRNSINLNNRIMTTNKYKNTFKTMKGGKTYTNPNDKINAMRRVKYMDLFTLTQFKARNKSAPTTPPKTREDIINRVIACLYYGYSTTIACNSGLNKEYFVKFSTVRGKLLGNDSKSSFDYKPPKDIPDFLIYNTFVISKNFGKEKPIGSLNLVTKLDPNKHLNYFFDLQELKNKVIQSMK